MSFKLQQEKRKRNPMFMVHAKINGTAEHEKHSPDYQKCEQHSKDTSAQWYASGSFSHPLTLFPSILFMSLHPSVYSGWGFSQFYLFNPPPSKSSNLTKPSLIAAQRQLCTSLCHACFSCLTRVHFLYSLHVPPVLFQTAIMCLSVAQLEAEWWLFSIPPAVYQTFSWFSTKWCELDVWYEEARCPARPLKHFTYENGGQVLMTCCTLLCRKQQNPYAIP